MIPNIQSISNLPPLILTAGGVNLTIPSIRLIKDCYPNSFANQQLACLFSVFLADRVTIGALAFDQKTVVFDKQAKMIGFSMNSPIIPQDEAISRLLTFQTRLDRVKSKTIDGWSLVMDYYNGVLKKSHLHPSQNLSSIASAEKK